MGLFHQSAEKEKLEALENVISKTIGVFLNELMRIMSYSNCYMKKRQSLWMNVHCDSWLD